MSIYKVNNNKSRQDQINDLNDMVLELEGLSDLGKFDKYEVDDLYAKLGIDRKFLRNQSFGNTSSDYSDWSHVLSEDGYSIWKIAPTNYAYNANNRLYFDDKLVANRGEATAESANTFDYVYFYNGDSGAGYTDNTTEAGTETGTEFSLMNSTNDYLYIGLDAAFSGIKFEWETRGKNYALKVEYYDITSGVNDWVELTANSDSLSDNTSSFSSNGYISWTSPSGWGETTVNSASAYWIRISTTDTPVTVAKAYYIIPYNSVPGLLAMSSSQIQDEDWAWCSYSGSIYVTIRNAGNSSYEGNYFITSSSSDTNLQNFFIHNHEYTGDYEDSTYDPVASKTTDYAVTGNEGVIIVDASLASVTLSLPSASEIEGKEIIIKVETIGGGETVTVDPVSGETIDGGGAYTSMTNNYDFVRLMSDGTNWIITGKN